MGKPLVVVIANTYFFYLCSIFMSVENFGPKFVLLDILKYHQM